MLILQVVFSHSSLAALELVDKQSIRYLSVLESFFLPLSLILPLSLSLSLFSVLLHATSRQTKGSLMVPNPS